MYATINVLLLQAKVVKLFMKRSKWIFLFSFIVLMIILIILDAGCPFRNTFGIICPSCGMTRAVLALFQLDFIGAFYYHPLVYALPIVFLYVLKDGKLFKNSVINYAVLALIIIGLIVNYIIKLVQLYG